MHLNVSGSDERIAYDINVTDKNNLYTRYISIDNNNKKMWRFLLFDDVFDSERKDKIEMKIRKAVAVLIWYFDQKEINKRRWKNIYIM